MGFEAFLKKLIDSDNFKNDERWKINLLLIHIAIFLNLVPHPINFTTVAGLALLSEWFTVWERL